jgi:hypothetical protein
MAERVQTTMATSGAAMARMTEVAPDPVLVP